MSLTDAGLTVDRLEDIRERMRENLVAAFGPNTNTDPDSVFGQLIDVFAAELVSVNELALQVYDSFDPDQAEGTQLDNLASLLGLTRQAAEASNGIVVLTGDDGTVVPTGSVVEASGNGNRFVTLSDVTITDTQFIGTYTFTDNDPNPDTITRASGSFLEDGFAPGTVVDVSGTGANDGTYTVAAVTAATLTLSDADELSNQGPSVAILTIGVVEVAVEGQTTGPLTALAQQIDTIVSSVAGWDTVVNPEDVDPGNNAETDLELRLRMEASKQATGAAVDGAIKAQLLEIAEVEFARVFSNRSDMTVDGRPPHSFEAVVYPDTGDPDYQAEIAALIFNRQPAGIESVGSSEFNVTDEQGFTQTVKYSFAAEIDIWFEVTITAGASYPADGDDQVAAAILAEGELQGVGDDVINWKYVAALDAIPGIIDVVVNQGFSASPVSDANLTIDETEIADVDSSRITVSS